MYHVIGISHTPFFFEIITLSTTISTSKTFIIGHKKGVGHLTDPRLRLWRSPIHK